VFKDYHLKTWYDRNAQVLSEQQVLSSISKIIQEQMQKSGKFDQSILTDGVPYKETLELINLYHEQKLFIRYKDKLWHDYETKLKLMEPKRVNNRMEVDIAWTNAAQAIDDARKAYRILCYGAETPRVLYSDPQLMPSL